MDCYTPPQAPPELLEARKKLEAKYMDELKEKEKIENKNKKIKEANEKKTMAIMSKLNDMLAYASEWDLVELRGNMCKLSSLIDENEKFLKSENKMNDICTIIPMLMERIEENNSIKFDIINNKTAIAELQKHINKIAEMSGYCGGIQIDIKMDTANDYEIAKKMQESLN